MKPVPDTEGKGEDMKIKSVLVLALFLGQISSAYAQQIPTKFIANSAVTAAKLNSGAATNGQVATANGSGGVTYVTPAGASTYIQEAPSGTINGSNTAFTLSQTPVSAASVLLFLDGVFMTQGVDYTISGTSITATGIVPATGQSLRAAYNY